MPLNAHELRQLEIISQSISQEDPGLACRLSRMSGYSLDSRRMALTAAATLIGCSAVLFAVGFGLRHGLCVAAGVAAAAAGVAVAGGWAWWAAKRSARRAPRRVRVPDTVGR